MIKRKRRNIDLDDTVELPVIDEQDFHKDLDPFRILLPFVAKVGIFLGIVLSCTLLFRAIYLHTYGQTISLLDDQQITFVGTNGNGTISTFKPESTALQQLKEDYRDKQRKKQDTTDLGTLIKSIDCSFSQSDYLSNGMVITYACTYNHDAAKQAKYNFTNTTKTYTVKNLKQVQQIDVFEDLQTEWSYDDDIPTLSITNSKYNDLDISYSYTLDSNASATVTASFNEDDLLQQGYQIKNTTKTIEIPKEQLYSSETIEAFFQSYTSKVSNDLAQCSSYSFGKEEINAYDPTYQSYSINEDGTVTVTYNIHNLYTDLYPSYYSFTISYTGYLYKDQNGTIIFSTNTNHACMYDGFSQSYQIIEKE